MKQSPARQLIVNADDFGYGNWVNRGVVEAHRRGIVTSASLMVRQRGTADAVRAAQGLPELDLGLHLDLGEWAYRGAEWQPLYEVVDNADEEAVREEAWRQAELFHTLTGATPSHLDTHQHVHQREPYRSVAAALAADLGVPLRGGGGIRFEGAFYAQTTDGQPLPDRVSRAALLRLLRSLPLGVTELSCHPGEEVDEAGSGGTMYRAERRVELATLTDPGIRHVIEELGVQLTTFRAIAAVYS